MDREYFIDVLNRGLTSSPTVYDITNVLTEFCNRKDPEGKYQDIVQSCIAVLINSNAWSPYYQHAIKYLIKAYQVNTWYDAEKMVPTPFGEQPERKIIKFV